MRPEARWLELWQAAAKARVSARSPVVRADIFTTGISAVIITITNSFEAVRSVIAAVAEIQRLCARTIPAQGAAGSL